MPQPTPRPGQHWRHSQSGNVIQLGQYDRIANSYATDTRGVRVNYAYLLDWYRQMSTREVAAYTLFGITDLGTVSDAEDESIDRRLREDAQSD